MRKQDRPTNLPECRTNKEDCICDQLLICQPGEIIKVRGDFTPDSSLCVKRFTKTLIKSQNFQWKHWPEPVPVHKAEATDKLYDSEFIVMVLQWGLVKAENAGVVNPRQHLFIKRLIEKLVPFYVEVYCQGKDIGYEFAGEDSFMSVEEFKGLTGMED